VAPVIGSSVELATEENVYRLAEEVAGLLAVTFNWVLPFTQIGFGVAVGRLTTGLGFTVTVLVAVPVHPKAPVAVTV